MLSSRILWWKRANKSPYGVKGIERLMRDIRPDDPRPVLETTRLKKAPNQKKRMKNLLTGMDVPPNQKKRMKKFLKGLKHIPPKRMGQRLHVMKRKIRSEQKKKLSAKKVMTNS